MSFFSKLFVLIIFIAAHYSGAQSKEDLEFLNLLPDNQVESISSKLGIQTGKPINDTIRMDDFDNPSFVSSKPKTSQNNLANGINFDSFDLNKVFGLDLFKESPSTFAPIDLAPAPMDYTLGPGDELKIQFFGSITVNRIAPVNREGNIVIPELGSIEVSGLNFIEAKNKIQSVIKASLIGVTSEISLAKIRSIQIFVLGNAFSPGAYTVSSLSNISNVLFFSGGPSKNGSLRNISVKRNGQEIAVLDFYEFLIKGNIKNDIKLQSNDAIVINPTGKTVSIFGQVKNQAQYELIKDENFSDLIFFASGFTNKADINNITLSSYAENGERIYLNYSLSEIQNVSLKDGDEIFIHSLPNTPRNVVRIVGEISSSGSVAFEPNLTLEDLIKPEDFYGFGKGVINTDEWSAIELQIKRAYEWDRINFPPSRPEHHQKIAKMLGITLEELNIWRKETRQNAGVEVKSADKTDVQVFGADERSKKYFKEELPSLEPLSH